MELYPYQKKAKEYMRQTPRAYLFGEMGIGKTPISLCAIEQFPALIVVPNYLKKKWILETRRWLDGVDVVMTGGDKHGKTCIPGHDIYVANYESIRARFDDYRGLRAKTVIWDESHTLRNRKAQVSAKACAISKTIPVCWELSGTAFVTGPADLWHQFKILFPQRYTSYWSWCQRHLVVTRGHWGTDVGTEWAPYSNISEEVAEFLLKIRRQDVLPELPLKTRETVELEPTPAQLKMKEEIEEYRVVEKKDSSIEYLAWELQRQTRLLQVSVTPAMVDPTFVDPHPAKFVYILDQLSKKAPLIVFARQVKMLDMLHDYIQLHKPEIVVCRQQQNQAGAYAFQDGHGDVLLAQIDSARYGLDLHRAWRAIFLECPWTYADIVQLEDRMMRPDQHNAVLSTFLVTSCMKDAQVVDIVRDRRLAFVSFISNT